MRINSTNFKLKSNYGFTLIELMIVVAVIGILSAVAYPAYTESVLKGKRAQGRSALVELMQQQERYMTQYNCYIGFTTNSSGATTPLPPSPTTACGSLTPTTVPFKAYAGDSASSASYLLSSSVCTGQSIANCVTVTATPRHNDAKVGVLSLSSTGVKSCSGTASTTNPKLCWP